MTATLTSFPSSSTCDRSDERAPWSYLDDEPLGFEAGDANVRRYVGNAPTNATDPSGLEGVQLSPEELATLLAWLDQPAETPKQPLMGDVAGENAKGEMVLEYTPFGAYPGDRNARAAYYGSHGPDREDPQGRPRRQYVACSRCHAFNNWGWPKDPDSPPFVDEFGWVNPEYIDKEEPVRTVTNQLLTLVGGAFFLSTSASAFPKGAIPGAPVATSEGIGGAAVTVRTTAARASVGGFVQSESRGAFVIVVDQGTAGSNASLVTRAYVGAGFEATADLTTHLGSPSVGAGVSGSVLLSSGDDIFRLNDLTSAFDYRSNYAPQADVISFANRYEAQLNRAVAERMRRLGIPNESVGLQGTPLDQAFETRQFPQGGANLHPNWSGVQNPVINVDIGALDARFSQSSVTWARASWKDRIDAVVAHEWTEVMSGKAGVGRVAPGQIFQEGRHIDALRYGPTTSLSITDKARQILIEDRAYWLGE